MVLCILGLKLCPFFEILHDWMTILGNLQSMFFFGFYRSSRFEIVILLSNFNTLHTCMSCTSFICEKIEDLVESISHARGRFSLPSLSKVNLSCFDTISYYSERHASLNLLYIFSSCITRVRSEPYRCLKDP